MIRIATGNRRPVSCAVPVERLIVIADAHIGAASPESESALLRFLAEAPGLGDSLLVAGDLFEFWFSWRRAIPRRTFRVAAALTALAARMPVRMVGGNHDRWGRPFWAEEAGIEWSARALDLEVAGHSVHAMHGDGVAERPGRISWSHRIVGHPLTAHLFGLLHPDLGIWLVDRLAPLLGERRITPELRAASAARQVAHARRLLSGPRAPWMLIMGHTHTPALEEVAPGRFYLNPGAWLDGHRYAVVTMRGAELCTF